MEYFKPSQKVLDEISNDGKIHTTYTTFMPDPLEESGENYSAPFISSIHIAIENFYRFRDGLVDAKHISLSREGRAGMIHLLSDALANQVQHGTKNLCPQHIGLFLGNRGVCYGFYDEGDYFKRPEVKKDFESKVPRVALDKTDIGKSRGIGVREHIYPLSDMIEVDNNLGVLYCVQSLERLYSPKSE